MQASYVCTRVLYTEACSSYGKKNVAQRFSIGFSAFLSGLMEFSGDKKVTSKGSGYWIFGSSAVADSTQAVQMVQRTWLVGI